MIRVLHVFHEMANGGIESFVMNYYRHIDREKVQFDFLTSVEQPGYYDEEIKTLGGKLFKAYPFKKNPIRNYMDIAKIVKENQYSIVHRHTGSAFGYFDLRAARCGGAEHLILHAHNPKAGKQWLHKLCKGVLAIPCERLACSQEAGRFLFGEQEKFIVVNNAIDCDKYRFNEAVRRDVRKELDATDALVIGHIGRFEAQKNHEKLLEIFAEIYNKRKDSVLVCVGDGAGMQTSKQLAEKLGIGESVRFLGTRNDVNQIIQGFDAFLFPSLYEGFPLTMLEVQVNGLACFTSKDVVPSSVDITGTVQFIPLEENSLTWADCVLNTELSRHTNNIEKVKKAGYDISSEAKKLEAYYEKLPER